MNPSDEENQSQGPVIRDRRRIDPQTGQVRDIPARPSRASTRPPSSPVSTPLRRSPAAQGARAPGGGMPGGGRHGGGERPGRARIPWRGGAGRRGGRGDASTMLALAERTADLQRLQAEYANYRKRVERDRVAVREQALANVLSELLPVLDDIGRAREHGELTGGFKSVAESLEASVAKLGLTTFGESGDPFDPTAARGADALLLRRRHRADLRPDPAARLQGGRADHPAGAGSRRRAGRRHSRPGRPGRVRPERGPLSTKDFLEKDYYKTLGVAKAASADEIKKSYRKLARKYHPDANEGDAKSEERFKEISEAYNVLSDDERRKEYDEARSLFGSGGARMPATGGPGRGRRVLLRPR